MIYQYFFMNNLDSGYKELESRSMDRALTVFYSVTVIFFVFFVTVGVFGYLTYLDAIIPAIVDETDTLSVIGKLGMFVFINISTMVGF